MTELEIRALAVANEIDALTPERCRREAAPEFLSEEDDTHGPYVAMIYTIARREAVSYPQVYVGVADSEEDPLRICVGVRSDDKDSDLWLAVDAELSRLARERVSA